MNPLSIVTGLLGKIADKTGFKPLQDVLHFLSGDNISKLPPEQQAAIQEALMQHEKDMRSLDIEELKAFMSESLAEIQSPDKFVSRSRPTQVYIAGGITAALAIGMLFGVKLDTGAIVTLLAPLWGNAMWYTKNRTDEKKLGVATK